MLTLFIQVGGSELLAPKTLQKAIRDVSNITWTVHEPFDMHINLCAHDLIIVASGDEKAMIQECIDGIPHTLDDGEHTIWMHPWSNFVASNLALMYPRKQTSIWDDKPEPAHLADNAEQIDEEPDWDDPDHSRHKDVESVDVESIDAEDTYSDWSSFKWVTEDGKTISLRYVFAAADANGEAFAFTHKPVWNTFDGTWDLGTDVHERVVAIGCYDLGSMLPSESLVIRK